jgi:uncharacterized protein with GYD domain
VDSSFGENRGQATTKEEGMPKYLYKARYTAEGVKGLAKGGGSARRDAVTKMVEGLGGSLDAFYFAFGATDGYVVVDLPDNESAAAVAMAVGGAGLVSLETVTLLTPEEVDAAAKKSVDYSPPGK